MTGEPSDDPADGADPVGTGIGGDRRTDATPASERGRDDRNDSRTDHRVSRREMLKFAGLAPFGGSAVDTTDASHGTVPAGSLPLVFGARDSAHLVSYTGVVRRRPADVGALGPLQLGFDSDGTPVLPYVTGDGTLTILDGSGGRQTVSTPGGNVRLAASGTRLAVGVWARRQSVLAVDEAHEAIYRLSPGGVPTAVGRPDGGARAVLGVADVVGTGDDDLVFVDREGRLRVLRPDGTTASLGPDAGPTVATDPGVGAGAPATFGGADRSLVPVVDEDGDIHLVGAGGTDRRLTDDGSVAAGAPLASVDVDDDGDLEVVFVSPRGEVGYVDDVGGRDRIERLSRRSIHADERTGVVGTRRPEPLPGPFTGRRRVDLARVGTGLDRGRAVFEGEETTVALDGSTAVVASPRIDPGADADTGAASVFVTSAGEWEPQVTLTTEEGGGLFGTSVALSGITLLVGASLDPGPNGAPTGRVSVFTRTDGNWRPEATLAPADPGGLARFGTAVDVDGDTAIVGASGDTGGRGEGTGTASVFTRSDGTWTLATRLGPDAAGVDQFGTAVALDGDTAVVGARHDDGPGVHDVGVAYVFSRTARGWTQQARLEPGGSEHDSGGADGNERDDGFGTEIAISDGTIVVGAPTETNARGHNAGAVYVFTGSNGTWHQHGRLLPGDGASDDGFGTAVAVDGETLLVGTEFGGGPYVYGCPGGVWSPRTTLDGDGLGRVGAAVALDVNRAVLWAGESEEPDDTDQGSAWVFES